MTNQRYPGADVPGYFFYRVRLEFHGRCDVSGWTNIKLPNSKAVGAGTVSCAQSLWVKKAPASRNRNRRGFVCHNKSTVCHNCNEKLLQRKDFLLFPVVPDVLHIVIPRAKPSVGKLKTCCKSSSFQFCVSPKGLEISLCISQPI